VPGKILAQVRAGELWFFKQLGAVLLLLTVWRSP